jgi:bifunctional N-acetylglucosamine-1-phosphate-uridyltransferase/glucosamine-1-phosphate-acetyltransferase GlmU-like protein
VSWRGVVTALDPAARYRSRISVYQHPLAGRPVLWHVIAALSSVEPPPESITLLHREDMGAALPPSPVVPVDALEVAPGEESRALRRVLGAAGTVTVVDGRAPLVASASLGRLLRAADDGVAALAGADDSAGPIAVAGEGVALAALDDPMRPDAVAPLAPVAAEESIRIEDRGGFARAAVALRDRIVRRHQEHGVSFLLPDTTWIDADVTIGSDTMVYPGVILEGMTDIGSECVIGPYCRIVESRIGRGVELKGWNYVTHISIRNHAVLDPYVRRGYE